MTTNSTFPIWVTPAMAVVATGGTEDVDAALRLILGGDDAFVASESVAVEVLGRLGLTEAEVEDRLAFAYGRANGGSVDLG